MSSSGSDRDDSFDTRAHAQAEDERPPVREQAAEICLDILGSAPDRIDTPGGQSRDAVRAWFGEQSLIVARRTELKRARLESAVLRSLNEAGVPVPRLIASRGEWVLQQDLGTERLSQVMARDVPYDGHLGSAIGALQSIQEQGTRLGFPRQLPVLGEAESWSRGLVDRRRRVDAVLSLRAPDLDHAGLHHLLRVREPRFLKWDARPGNAIITASGGVGWIDWEHCGVRNGLDDLVWLLADEYTPGLDREASLLDEWLPAFAEAWSRDEARDYFHTYGALHSIVRLGYILHYKQDGLWWDPVRCLALDKVGVTREHAMHLCHRASRWAAESSLLPALVPWFDEVEQAIPA